MLVKSGLKQIKHLRAPLVVTKKLSTQPAVNTNIFYGGVRGDLLICASR